MRLLPRFIGLTIVLAGVNSFSVQSQDPQFSQYFNAPLYLNPGFTGLTEAGRVGINYRIQGQGTASKFVTSSAFVDYNLSDFNISTGLLAVSDKEEFNGYKSTVVAVPISYFFQLNKSLAVKPAIELSYTSKVINFSSLLFGDQLDASGNIVRESRERVIAQNNVNFFNLAFGVVTYSKRTWMGFAVHNLADQRHSFIESGGNSTQKRYTFHSGIKLERVTRNYRNKRRQIYMPTFNFVQQGNFHQLDAGIYSLLNPVVWGLTYRGVPIFGSDQQAISVLLGLRKFNFNLGYSFDFVLNRSVETGGTHELTLGMTFDPRDPAKPPRDDRKLKCPAIITR